MTSQFCKTVILCLILSVTIRCAYSQSTVVDRDSKPTAGTLNDAQVISRALALVPGNQPVIESLELQDYQLDKIKAIQVDFNKKLNETAKTTANATSLQRQAEFEILFDELDKSMSEVLLPDQNKRLRQIAIQSLALSQDGSVNLPNLLGLKSVRLQLKITSKEMHELRKLALQERERLELEIKQLKQESQERLLSKLSPEQKAQLIEMTGETFDFQGLVPDRFGRFRKASDDH